MYLDIDLKDKTLTVTGSAVYLSDLLEFIKATDPKADPGTYLLSHICSSDPYPAPEFKRGSISYSGFPQTDEITDDFNDFI